MPTFITPPWTCPECLSVLDRAEYMAGHSVDGGGNPTDDATPSPGAFSICMSCASFLRFEAGMRLSVATEEDLADAPVSFLEVLAQVQEIVKLMHADRAERGEPIKTDAKRMN